MVKISVVIVNYKVKDLLLKCLYSIVAYTPKDFEYEIIVVDNNSCDGSVEAIKEKFKQVILIENDFNAGFPKANNQGFEIAKGKYIFMLNPDTEFIDNALGTIFSFLEGHLEIDVIAPALLNTNLSHQQSVWRYPTVQNIFCEMHYLTYFLKFKNYSDKNLNQPFEAESFSGAAIVFKKEIISKIGMLDESMFWIEDVEFCYRAKQNGFKLLYYPEVKIIHHIGQSAKKNYNISLSNQIFNKIKFFKKHHSYAGFLIVVLLSFYHVLLKLIVFSILSPFKPMYRRKAVAYAYTLPKVFNPPSGIA